MVEHAQCAMSLLLHSNVFLQRGHCFVVEVDCFNALKYQFWFHLRMQYDQDLIPF